MKITCYEDISKLNLEAVLAIMAEKPEADKEAFKEFASTPVVSEVDGSTRKRSFFEMRNWVVSKYFPEALVKEKQPSMMDKIMSL